MSWHRGQSGCESRGLGHCWDVEPGVRAQGPAGLQPNHPSPFIESEWRNLFSQGIPMLLDPCPLTLG